MVGAVSVAIHRLRPAFYGAMSVAMFIASSERLGPGRPSVDSEAVNVRMERPMLTALDDFAADQPEPALGRPEAVRRALADYLRGKGYLPAVSEGQ